MMTHWRYVTLVLGIIVSLHFMLSFTHDGYSRATSVSQLWTPSVPPYKIPLSDDYYIKPEPKLPLGRRANAAIVMLARNRDMNGAVNSIKQLEDRWNGKFQYPYVILNEEEFTKEFKERVLTVASAEVKFGVIPPEQWRQPEWIDEKKAALAREKMVQEGVIYAGSVAYRNMCRFNAGLFFNHELLREYKYYWRLEPDIKYFCDIDYDPFLVMHDQKKVYGFTVSLYEYQATIPTLWETVKEFIEQYPQYLDKDNSMSFLSDDGGATYNRCHFWSNFEIGDLDFMRGEAYTQFFNYLDRKGGFYYERWGDAPIHSIAVALFAKKEQIHFFHDIGYRHEPFQHCPQGDAHKKGKCYCDPKQNFDYEWYSCLNRYDRMFMKS